MKFGRIVLQVNMHRSTESDFQFSFLASHFQDGSHFPLKVLPPGE